MHSCIQGKFPLYILKFRIFSPIYPNALASPLYIGENPLSILSVWALSRTSLSDSQGKATVKCCWHSFFYSFMEEGHNFSDTEVAFSAFMSNE